MSRDILFTNIEARAEICKRNSIRYAHVIFPSKPVIMEDFLPDSLQGKIRSLYEHHYRVGPEDHASILYPKTLLVEAREESDVFRRHDTHMTAHGYMTVMRSVFQRLGYSHDPLEHVTKSKISQGGDLAVMLGVPLTLAEDVFSTPYKSEQFFDNLVYLDGNTDNISIMHNPLSQSTERLLALGDSFIKDCLALLATYFRDILYLRSSLFQPDMLHTFCPDAIISSNAERYLTGVTPDSKADSFVLHKYGAPDYVPAKKFTDALTAMLAYGPYPQVYRDWSRQTGALCFERLGTAACNSEITQASDRPGWLRSTGNDPYMTFHHTGIAGSAVVQIEVEMDSSTSGTFQVFPGLCSTSGYPFSEQSSLKAPVAPGRNQLRFTLASADRSGPLRLDPLDRPGDFILNSIKVTDLG